MKKRKITKRQRKAQRAAERAARRREEFDQDMEPLVTVQTVGEDITLEEVIALFSSPSMHHVEWGTVGFDDQVTDDPTDGIDDDPEGETQ